MRRAIFFLTIPLFLDQGLKMIVRAYPWYWQGTFFRFTENAGIAFSIPLATPLLWWGIVVAFIFLIFIALRQVRSFGVHAFIPFALLFSGATSNAIDRIRFGAVTDIFALPGGLLFNIADGFIVFGIFLLLWHSRFSLRQS